MKEVWFIRTLKPLPDDKILDWSKLKQSADNNFEFDVNSRKFSKLVENTVGKGEIARDEQFLLFSLCFQRACFARASTGVIVWELVKPFTWPMTKSFFMLNSAEHEISMLDKSHLINLLEELLIYRKFHCFYLSN